MRPFWPLAAFCLLLHLTTACKEIKLKFDLQRMVERELNKIPNNLTSQILSPGTAKKICAGTPRITRGMGTNITLEPGERVSLAFIVTLDIASGESCFSHLDLVIGQTSSFPIYENIKQVSKITTFKFSFCSGGYWF